MHGSGADFREAHRPYRHLGRRRNAVRDDYAPPFSGWLMKGMIRRTQCALVCALLLAAAVVGCSKSEYVPDIRVAQARPIIDATAEFHDVYPAPALVSGKEKFGLTGPNAEQVAPHVLAEQVRKELLDAFDQSGMFSKITTFDPHPDLVLTTRINSLHEHYRPHIWTRIPYIGTVADVLDMKTHVSSGEADLTVFVLTSSGELVGTYRGFVSFKESFNWTGEVPPGTRLNHALSEAVQEIQGKILKDVHLRTIAAR